MGTIVYISDFRLPHVLNFVKPLRRFAQHRKVLIIEKEKLENVAVLSEHFDQIHYIDTLDSLDQIKSLVAHIMRTEQIVALLTPGENAIEIGGEIRSTFGIGGLQRNQAVAVRNKWIMKEMLRQRGVRTSAAAIALHPDDYRRFVDAHGLPLIIKPVSGFASINTFKISSEEELRDYLVNHRRDGQSDLLEEFIRGVEFHCDSIVCGGAVAFASVSQYLFNCLEIARNGAPPGSITYPDDSQFPHLEALRDINRRAIAALGINNSVTHAELFLTDAGEIVFGEVGARIGGAQVIPPCVKNTHGVDLFDAVSDLELGTFQLRHAPRAGIYTGMICFPTRAGTIQRISTARDFSHVEGIVDFNVAYKLGQKVGDVNDTMTRSGFAIVEARSFEPLRQALIDLYNGFVIDVAA
jgi:hypothetical protein